MMVMLIKCHVVSLLCCQVFDHFHNNVGRAAEGRVAAVPARGQGRGDASLGWRDFARDKIEVQLRQGFLCCR
jgi:hypothetical protein